MAAIDDALEKYKKKYKDEIEEADKDGDGKLSPEEIEDAVQEQEKTGSSYSPFLTTSLESAMENYIQNGIVTYLKNAEMSGIQFQDGGNTAYLEEQGFTGNNKSAIHIRVAEGFMIKVRLKTENAGYFNTDDGLTGKGAAYRMLYEAGRAFDFVSSTGTFTDSEAVFWMRGDDYFSIDLNGNVSGIANSLCFFSVGGTKFKDSSMAPDDDTWVELLEVKIDEGLPTDTPLPDKPLQGTIVQNRDLVEGDDLDLLPPFTNYQVLTTSLQEILKEDVENPFSTFNDRDAYVSANIVKVRAKSNLLGGWQLESFSCQINNGFRVEWDATVTVNNGASDLGERGSRLDVENESFKIIMEGGDSLSFTTGENTFDASLILDGVQQFVVPEVGFGFTDMEVNIRLDFVKADKMHVKEKAPPVYEECAAGYTWDEASQSCIVFEKEEEEGSFSGWGVALLVGVGIFAIFLLSRRGPSNV
tara:strand:+ start:9623 stop:11038 length:1416 start_codon:yes stop_codon:yes gene_type:complete